MAYARQIEKEMAGEQKSKSAGRSWLRLWLLPLTMGAVLALWWAVIEVSSLPAFILPPPDLVWHRFVEVAQNGTLLRHTAATGVEVLLGLVFGLVLATILGYVLAKSPALERLLSPYIVASQSIPTIAIAPLLIIWFGPGRISKVLVATLIVFFPVLVNTVVGVRSVPADLYELMRSLRATRWQIFTKLEIPSAMPVLFGGLKIGATLSVIGAVVGEFVGADEGLGFLINLARGMYDTPLVFVAIFTLILLAMALYGVVNLLERWFLRWRRQKDV